MKSKWYYLSACLTALFLIVFACSKDDEGAMSDIETFHSDIVTLTDATAQFVEAAVDYESARFDTLELADIEGIYDEYLDAGDRFVSYFQKITGQDNSSKHFAKSDVAVECVKVASGFFDVSGISAGMVYDISELIKTTRDTVRALKQAYDMQIIDGNQYHDLLNNVRVEKPLDAVGVGFSGAMGAGAGAFTTLACGAAGVVGAPALLIIGGTSATVGYGTYKLWSWYRGSDKDDEGTMHISYITAEMGQPIPATLFGDGANMAIAIDGHVPLLINDFPYPDEGNALTMEINIDDLNTLQTSKTSSVVKSDSDLVEVCYWQEPAVEEDCNMIMAVSGSAHPTNPSAGQSVTVLGSVIPVVAGCDISFSIVGTDGYTNSGTYQTNSSGQASFGIPGASAGVIDRVTITANNVTYVVTYVFSGSSKDEPVDRLAASR